jgi:uncharacterized protein (DUF362 family)
MAGEVKRLNRREILKTIGAGLLGATLGSSVIGAAESPSPRGRVDAQPGKKGPFRADVPEPGRVSLVKGSDRREIVYQALKNIEDDILGSIGNKKILIKPNFVATNVELCATHVEAIRAILDFLRPHCRQEIVVGESTASRAGTFDGFKNYGYFPLEKEYNVKLVDLNKQDWEYRYVIGRGNRPQPIRIISTFLDPDVYIISAAKMKTHDRVLTTLSLKNVLLGAPVNDYSKNDKSLTHREHMFSREAVLHYNMFQLAREIYPDLGVMDGFVGMEGNGPVGGTPVDARLALASRDPLAMDVLTTKLMGFDPSQIMYLTAMAEAGMGQGDVSKMEILGTPAAQCQYQFKPSRHMVEPYNLKA